MKYALKNSNGNKMVKKTLKHFTAIKMLKEMEENAVKNVSWNPRSQKEKSCQKKKNLTFKYSSNFRYFCSCILFCEKRRRMWISI